MAELTVVVGGSVGADPYSPRTWSGTSAALLASLRQHGALDAALGVKLPRLLNYALLAKNFHRDRRVWRRHFYLDPQYRRALTRAAGRLPIASPACLQYGAMFSLPAVFPQKRCFSYSDGNLPESLASGYGFEGISRRRIDQALRYEEEVAQQMTGIFTFSEYLRQSFIRDYRVPAAKVFAIGGAVNLAQIPEPVEHRDFASQQLLFLGIEFERKGGPLLLAAFARLRQRFPAAVLHIAGPASIGAVPEGVVFHGRLSRDVPAQRATLENLFRTCTLFVLPSLYEPYGIAPLEAMFYGMPCLLTDAWAFRENVQPGITGELVQKGSAEDLYEKLAGLLADPEKLSRMGTAARTHALGNFTWDAVVTRMQAAIATPEAAAYPR